MDGINTAIVGYILLCIVMPHLIKNKTQYYMALFAMLLNIVLRSIGMLGGAGLTLDRTMMCIGLLLTAASLILLVLASGGLSIGEFASEMGGAIGETFGGQAQERTPIVPLTGEQPKSRDSDDDPHR